MAPLGTQALPEPLSVVALVSSDMQTKAESDEEAIKTKVSTKVHDLPIIKQKCKA